jgi:hypothetical protein
MTAGGDEDETERSIIDSDLTDGAYDRLQRESLD